VSSPFEFNHPLYTDYDANRGYNPPSGIYIPGPTTASGSIPNINDLVPPGLTAFNYLYPVWCSATPELQYPAEDALCALTPLVNTTSNALQLYLEDSPQGPLSYLLTLANVTTLQRPASTGPNTDSILIASPIALHYPDPLNINQP
jgi:hypothetical protein